MGAYTTIRAALETFAEEAGAILGQPPGSARLFTGSGAPWRLGLCTPNAQIWLAEAGSQDRALLHADGFSLSYEGEPPGEWVAALQRRLSADRQRALSSAIDGLRSATALRPPEELPLEDHLHELGAEAPLLEPLALAYREHYGESVALVRWPSGPPSLLFPDVVPEQSIFLQGSSHLERDVRFAAYLRDLGYGMVEGKLRLVPTPAAFVARREALGLDEHGLRPRLVRARSPALSPRVWLRSLGRGVFPINVRGALAYRLTRPARELGRRIHRELATLWNSHFHALGHDMSLHVFSMHRLERRHTRPLTERAHRATRALDPRRVLSVAGYVEGDLTRHCTRVWNDIDTPEAFEFQVDADFPALP